jgi:hypothetical protein
MSCFPSKLMIVNKGSISQAILNLTKHKLRHGSNFLHMILRQKKFVVKKWFGFSIETCGSIGVTFCIQKEEHTSTQHRLLARN